MASKVQKKRAGLSVRKSRAVTFDRKCIGAATTAALKNAEQRPCRRVAGSKRRTDANTSGSVARRLKAGVRCHNRFYGALANDLNKFRSNGGSPSKLIVRLFEHTLSLRTLKTAFDVRLTFEVNLGRRRPDCICMIKTGEAETADVICIILELKTCKFVKNMTTGSKQQQTWTGIRQLMESAILLERIMPPGCSQFLICPLLVFVAQRGLDILRITRFAHRRVSSNFAALSASIAGLSEYHIPTKGKRRKAKCICSQYVQLESELYSKDACKIVDKDDIDDAIMNPTCARTPSENSSSLAKKRWWEEFSPGVGTSSAAGENIPHGNATGIHSVRLLRLWGYGQLVTPQTNTGLNNTEEPKTNIDGINGEYGYDGKHGVASDSDINCSDTETQIGGGVLRFVASIFRPTKH
ncbi:UL24 [anatid alphaherpesvirus 1]|nr:UL24 [Anatid alphaherpesvirus 1]